MRLDHAPGERGYWGKVALAALTVACVGSLFFAASPADARTANVFKSYFGAASSTPSNPYPLSEPTDVAVDEETHDIYITDSGNHRVEKFDSSGNLILMFGKAVNQTTGGNVCTIASGDTCQAGSAGSSPGELTTPTFIAVDNSGGPSNGDVYVGDTGDGSVSKFEPSGTLVETWGIGGQLDRPTSNGPPFGTIAGITIDASGNLYVFNQSGSMYSFGQEGSPIRTVGTGFEASLADIAVDSSKNLYVVLGYGDPFILKLDYLGGYLGGISEEDVGVTGLAFDTSSYDLFVDDSGGTIVNRYNEPCLTCALSASFGSGDLTGARGIAVDGQTHNVFVANTASNNVAVFSAVYLPNVTTEAATNPGQTTETINGHIDPAGGANVNSCRFEYGTDTTYSLGSVPCSQATPYSSPTDVSANLTGLTPETTYHYRLVAGNENGSTEGKDETVTAHWVPGIGTDPPTHIAAHSATLNGSWLGDEEDTHYYFEYGPTESYGSTSAIPPGTDGGSAIGSQSVSFKLAGLATFTTYHFRIVASNPAGTSYGRDVAFHTLGGHVFTSAFGSAGSGSGQLSNPQAVAVDESTGDVYVADTGNHRVVVFNANGGFVSTWGWGVSDGQAVSEVCTATCEKGVPGSGPGQFTTPTFIAVDNSPGPSAGDVYVADTADNTVQEFEPSGHLVTSWGTEGVMKYGEEIGGIAVSNNGKLIVQPGAGNGISVDSFGRVIGGSVAIELSTNNQYYNDGDEVQEFRPSGSPVDSFGNGILNSASGIAINSGSGVLYVANSGNNEISTFSPLPLPEVTTMPAVILGPTSATLVGHVDPNDSGNVTECRFEYGTDATYSLGSVPCSPSLPYSGPVEVTANLTGLTPFTTYHFRLVAAGAQSQELEQQSNDRTFTPAPGIAPSVDSISANELTPTDATLDASINPNNSATIYRFQYGTSVDYGSQTPPSEPIGSDSVDHPVSEVISGLQPGTTYHFRAVAVNFSGVTSSLDGSFTTPAYPSITTAPASDLDPTTAVLNATILPGYRSTTYHFEYGRTNSYGSSTPESAPIGSDDSGHSVSAPIAGLSPEITYHFRVVATNSIGATDGPDQTFTTAAAPTITPKPVTCKSGFVKKHGKCVKKSHHHGGQHKRKHHRRSN